MTYIFEYDIVPGMQKEFFEFMAAEGGKFWTQFDEVKKYEIFTKLGGSPLYEAHVELDSFEDFAKIRKHPDWGKVSEKTSKYLLNMQRRFIMPEVTYE